MTKPGAAPRHDEAPGVAMQSVNTSVWLPLRQVLEMLDARAEATFDEILTLAADLLQSEHASILFHEGARCWFKSRGASLQGDAVPSAGSFVRHTMASDELFIVTDAGADPRFADHPRVAGPPHIRSYVGAPLIGAQGQRLGALAVMDPAPRAVPTAIEQRLLRQLAADIMREIDVRARAYAGAIGRATGRAIAAGTSETVITIAPDWTILIFEPGKDGMPTPATNPIGASLWTVLPRAEGSRLAVELRRAMTARSIADFDEPVAAWQRLITWRIFPLETGGIVLTCRAADRASEAEFAMRASEARLSRSEEHLSRAQALAQVGSAELDYSTGANFWSDQMYRIFGWPIGTTPPNFEQMVGEIVHPDDHAALRENYRRQKEGERAPRCEYRIIRADGAVRTLLRLGEVNFDSEGRPSRYLTTIQDVTELRATERERDEYHCQLQHAQRLDALGTLAGGIAHDLNNTLVPVLALTQMILKDRGLDREHRRNLEVVRSAGERARDLVRQVLTFARKDQIERRFTNLRAVVADSMRLMRASIDPRIEIKARLMPTVTVFADPAQMHQLVVNLVANAAQAIGDRDGSIMVALALSPDDPDAVRLTITDDGAGMDEATLARMFEPFFTTKGYGLSSGLGLSIVHGVVTGHGGRVRAVSTPGIGTRITVELPIAETSPARNPETVDA
ncbi:MAG: ATP-binding protein [Stellaceae bacterium]